jgi:hypothetical protein
MARSLFLDRNGNVWGGRGAAVAAVAAATDAASEAVGLGLVHVATYEGGAKVSVPAIGISPQAMARLLGLLRATRAPRFVLQSPDATGWRMELFTGLWELATRMEALVELSPGDRAHSA